MKQRTVEKPEAIRIEGSELQGFVEMVVITNVQPVKTSDPETAAERTEYESDIARLTYPQPDDEESLRKYAGEHLEVFAQLAAAEEAAETPTQNADKIAALMIENAELRETQDDIVLTITDMMGGAE